MERKLINSNYRAITMEDKNLCRAEEYIEFCSIMSDSLETEFILKLDALKAIELAKEELIKELIDEVDGHLELYKGNRELYDMGSMIALKDIRIILKSKLKREQ